MKIKVTGMRDKQFNGEFELRPGWEEDAPGWGYLLLAWFRRLWS